jgi:hypothetical protein
MLDMTTNPVLWASVRAKASEEAKAAAAAAALRCHFTKRGDKGDGMMERMLRRDYNQEDIHNMSEEAFRTAAEKFRKDLFVSRATLLGLKDAWSAPLTDVREFVMGRLRRDQAVAMGMPNAVAANQQEVDVFVMGRLRRDQAVAMGMPNAVAANQHEVDVFVMVRLRRDRVVAMGMPNAVAANQQEVDVFVYDRLRRDRVVAMGMPNAVAANQQEVNVFVYDRLRRDRAVAMGMPNAVAANQQEVNVFVYDRLRRDQAVAMGMPNAVAANQQEVNVFVYDRLRRKMVAKYVMHDAATASPQQVNATVNVVLTGFRKEKAEVLQQHILNHLETHFEWRTADPIGWARGVNLCGKEITDNEKRGAHRSKETGVYPKTAFTDFMSKLKKALKLDPTLKGKMSPHARDEAHARFHVRYIIEHTFQNPSVSAAERDRFLTCLFYPLLNWLHNNNLPTI